MFFYHYFLVFFFCVSAPTVCWGNKDERLPREKPEEKGFYSKEWINIHTVPGYVGYDERVFRGFWIVMGTATLLATFHFCYRCKFPKAHEIGYDRFDGLTSKREQCIGDIVKGSKKRVLIGGAGGHLSTIDEVAAKKYACELEAVLDGSNV